MQFNDSTQDGQKIQTYYKLYTLPAILVVDPITGSALRTMTGFVPPERCAATLFCHEGRHLHAALWDQVVLGTGCSTGDWQAGDSVPCFGVLLSAPTSLGQSFEFAGLQ